jgi:prepilin-type N-terminal cleavage/methylation domain-containing protein
MKRPTPRGFTLLETLVALLLVGLALSLSVQLLERAQVATVEWRRTLPDPVPQFAIQLLRNDIQRANAVAGSPGTGPLVLTLPNGDHVAYEARLGDLERTVTAADGSDRGERAILRGLDFWSWRSPALGLVEIQLVYRHHRDPSGRILGGLGNLQHGGPRIATVTMRFSQRARPGKRVW